MTRSPTAASTRALSIPNKRRTGVADSDMISPLDHERRNGRGRTLAFRPDPGNDTRTRWWDAAPSVAVSILVDPGRSRSIQVESGRVRSSQVESGRVRSSQVESGRVRSGQVGPSSPG